MKSPNSRHLFNRFRAALRRPPPGYQVATDYYFNQLPKNLISDDPALAHYWIDRNQILVFEYAHAHTLSEPLPSEREPSLWKNLGEWQEAGGFLMCFNAGLEVKYWVFQSELLQREGSSS
jgi:hypothetical protein